MLGVCEDSEIESLLRQFISNTVQSSNLQSYSCIGKGVPALLGNYENTTKSVNTQMSVKMHHNSRRLSLEGTQGKWPCLSAGDFLSW